MTDTDIDLVCDMTPRRKDLMTREECLAISVVWDDAPVVKTVDAIQDTGRNVWISGFSRDLRFALIIDADNAQLTVAPIGTMHGLGRWECSKPHYDANSAIYHERFPLR